MKKIIRNVLLLGLMSFAFFGCSKKSAEKIELNVFVAASLNKVMTEIAADYEKANPNVKILLNADSSGTLMTQIREGYACDVFFSAAQKQMNTLEKEGFLVDGTRTNVLNNQLVVLTYKGSNTKETGLENIEQASSFALAGGSVPAGKYTRAALLKLGKITSAAEADKISTEEVSKALGNLEISEQSNVSKVLNAVVEGSCEVGTTYYSDTYGFENKVEILEVVPYSLTGNIIYPIAQVKNKEASETQIKTAADFVQYVVQSKALLKKYYFDTDL